MKTPKQLFELMEEEMPFNILPNSKIKPYVLELIKLAQEDAYLSGQINVLNSFSTLSTQINNKIYKKQ